MRNTKIIINFVIIVKWMISIRFENITEMSKENEIKRKSERKKPRNINDLFRHVT